ncbi:MAG: hypothetical protein U0271_18490 [Polyangiaceae bacterium]
MRLSPFVLVFAGSVLAGCGGSASETPWPAEPPDVDLDATSAEELNRIQTLPGRPAPVPSVTATATTTAPATPAAP